MRGKMKVTNNTESIELCTEAGWLAYDVTVDTPITREYIIELGKLGDLTYLSMLKQPFYRIENHYHMIKGLEGERQLRVAMLVGEESILDEVYKILQQEEAV